MEIVVAGPEHEPDLWRALLWAFDWRGAAEMSLIDIRKDDHIARYVNDWGRPGDAGVVALDEGRMLGAAWTRLMPADAPGYGYVARDVPELSMAVRPTARGRGVGARLLEACLAQARESGVHAVSLSVEDGNDAARALYMSRGFVAVGRVGDSDAMITHLERR